MVEVRDITSDAKMAERKPVTLIPGTIAAASHKTSALITNVKSPSVKKFKGRVNKSRIGLITAFKSPSTTAAKRAVGKFSILKPGTIFAATRRESAEKSQVSKSPINLLIT